MDQTLVDNVSHIIQAHTEDKYHNYNKYKQTHIALETLLDGRQDNNASHINDDIINQMNDYKNDLDEIKQMVYKLINNENISLQISEIPKQPTQIFLM